MASKYEIWAPLSDLESKNRYLYHYTKIDTCLKILYSETLQFSSISSTNDIFEQKPKIKFKSKNKEMLEKFIKVQSALKERRTKMQLLCFSKDSDENVTSPKDEADVRGRGFALPRMWAQYAENNQGVCLIINKSRLLQQLQKEKIEFWEHEVNYCDSFEVFPLEECDIINMEKNLNNPSVMSNSKYLELNYFSKLKDWESEREYRIATYCEGNEPHPIRVGHLFNYLEGVIVGQNCEEVYAFLLEELCRPNGKLVRKIFFDYTITSVLEVCIQNERRNKYVEKT